MFRRSLFFVTVLSWVFVVTGIAFSRADVARAQAGQAGQAGQSGQAAQTGQARGAGQGRGGGWTLPQGAADEKTPLTVNDAVIANGKKLFLSKCQKCHGPEGKGDGPDGDKEHAADMNLTVAARAARNPDGVVFYKIWNGRTTPKMPVFSEELSKEQAWAIVAYVQTLRAK